MYSVVLYKKAGGGALMKRSKAGNHPLTRFVFELMMVLMALLVLSPIIYMVLSSFRTDKQLSVNPIALPNSLYLDNYIRAFTDTNILTKLFNTVFVSVSTLGVLVFIGSMAGYVLGRVRRRWAHLVYFFFLTGAMIPFIGSIVPMYRLIGSLGLLDHMLVLIILPLGGHLPFVIMLYTGFIKSVPKEIEESAYIDGSGFINTYVKIVFPLMLPATVAVIITNIIGVWNDFLTPLLFISSDHKQTLALGVFSYMSEKITSYASVYAYTTLAILPLILIFLFLQKYFYKGLIVGSLKN